MTQQTNQKHSKTIKKLDPKEQHSYIKEWLEPQQKQRTTQIRPNSVFQVEPHFLGAWFGDAGHLLTLRWTTEVRLVRSDEWWLRWPMVEGCWVRQTRSSCCHARFQSESTDMSLGFYERRVLIRWNSEPVLRQHPNKPPLGVQRQL